MKSVIIEHPTRGVLRPDTELGSPDPADWHFSWSSSRADPNKCLIFGSVQAALKVLERMPGRKRDGCTIREYAPEEAKKINQLLDPYLIRYRADWSGIYQVNHGA